MILYMISITGATDGLVQIGFYLVGMKNGVASCAINRAKIFEVDAMLFGDRQFSFMRLWKRQGLFVDIDLN